MAFWFVTTELMPLLLMLMVELALPPTIGFMVTTLINVYVTIITCTIVAHFTLCERESTVSSECF